MTEYPKGTIELAKRCLHRPSAPTYKTKLNRFTSIGLSYVPSRFIVRRSNQFPVTHNDNIVIRYMEDSPYDADPAANSQLLQKFCFKTDYLYDLDSTNKKFDHVIDQK